MGIAATVPPAAARCGRGWSDAAARAYRTV